MNLRKALDKAKKERQSEFPKKSQSSDPPLRKALDKAEKERVHENFVGARAVEYSGESTEEKKEEQLTPVYSRSRHVTLDDDIVDKNRLVCLLPDSREKDLYKGIRTQIMQRMSAKNLRTLMITSALQGEGKTMTSINLAITFAKEKNHSVLLVDGDLRRQEIHKHLGYESNQGLNDYLVHDTPLNELIVWPGVEKLTVISGGKTVEDSTELLASEKMKNLVDELKSRYSNRFIILESPPVLSCPDTAAFSPFVDAIVMVVEAERTSVQEIKKSLKLIPKDKFLGFILNKKKGYGSDNYATYYNTK